MLSSKITPFKVLALIAIALVPLVAHQCHSLPMSTDASVKFLSNRYPPSTSSPKDADSIVTTESPEQQVKPKPEIAQVPFQSDSVNQISPVKSSLDQQPLNVKSVRSPSLAAEKLKRGLTAFMKQMNPASFFVPTQQVTGSQVKGTVSTQVSAEPAAIVYGEPTAEALIQGPSRKSNTRPIGGPLRWGRR